MKTRSEFALGWKPLLAAMIGTACGASPVPFSSMPVVIGPIHDATGWDFKSISIGVTIYGIIASLTAPYVGSLADRYGVRKVALWSLFLFGVAFASMWIVPNNIWLFWAFWVVIGVIGIGSTPVTWSRAVSVWFDRNRGLALGLMLIGTSVAGIVVPLIAHWAVAAGGWRAAYPALALLPLCIALPVGLLWFREPHPEERPQTLADSSGALVGHTLAEAAREPRFWALIASIAIISIAYGGAHIHMSQMVQLHGFSKAESDATIAIVALGILAGRLIVGLLFDRLWAPGVAFVSLLLPALGCYLLMGQAESLTIVRAGAFLLGFAAGAESDVIAFMAARYFGLAHYGKIYGLLYMSFGIGSAISPVLYGSVRDATGNYDLMLAAAMLMFAIGGALLLTLGRYPETGAPDRAAEPQAA